MQTHPSTPLIPDMRPGVLRAAQEGDLVLFVGAGVSGLLGCPSWRELGYRALKQLYDFGLIDYAEEQALSTLEIRKQLSIAIGVAKKNGRKIDIQKLLQPKKDAVERKEIYQALHSIGPVFVTTNYDKYLDDIAQQSGVAQGSIEGKDISMSSVLSTKSTRVYYRKKDLTPEKLYEPGVVLHLHGSIGDISSMVLTTEDYIQHYQNEYVVKFLTSLFAKKVVLFLGYGLAEEEILEYVLRKSTPEQKATNERKHFWLYPRMARDNAAYSHLEAYFSNNFGVELVDFNIDKIGNDQLAEVILEWTKQLKGKINRPVFSKEIKELLGPIMV